MKGEGYDLCITDENSSVTQNMYYRLNTVSYVTARFGTKLSK